MPTSTAALTVGGLSVAGTSQALGGRPAVALSETQYAAVSADQDGHNTLVEAVAGSRIRVVSLVMVASGGINTVLLQSGAGDIPVTGEMDLANNGQFILPYNPAGWCETGIGEPLNLELSDANLVAGVIGYVLA